MVYKVCPSCNQVSFSTRERSLWYCPFCGSDITFSTGFSSKSEAFSYSPEQSKKLYYSQISRRINK